MTITISLPTVSIARCRVEAWRVRQESKTLEHRDFVAKGVDDQCLGSCAELASSIVTGLRWTTEGGPYRKGKPDLGVDVGVKARRGPHAALYVRCHEPPGFRYILVTGPLYGTLTLRGWLLGEDVFRLGTLDPRPLPAYFVPQRMLHPIEELEEIKS